MSSIHVGTQRSEVSGQGKTPRMLFPFSVSEESNRTERPEELTQIGPLTRGKFLRKTDFFLDEAFRGLDTFSPNAILWIGV